MKSVPEAVTYLIQNTVYREILETLEPTLVHRGNIEKLLIVSLYQDYTRISSVCHTGTEKVFEIVPETL